MRTDLLIRPGWQDHRVIADLLAPGGPGRRAGQAPLITRLVLDATLAHTQPAFAEAAGAVGVPVVVDPMTYLAQYELNPDKGWAALPIGVAQAMTVEGAFEAIRKGPLVERVIRFQVDCRATAIIPPYFHALSPSDPWFEVTLEAMFETNRVMERMGIKLPTLPVLSGRLDRFGKDKYWGDGVDRFLDIAQLTGARSIALQLGPIGKPSDGYAKVLDLFQTTMHAQRPGLKVIAFRQGMFGTALAAVGISGYETGINFGDGTDIAALVSSRRPKAPVDPGDNKKGGGPGTRIYIPNFGCYIPAASFDSLNQNLSTRALLVCGDPVNCCPGGIASTMHDRRGHAIRSRARSISELESIPDQMSWRINHIANSSELAIGRIRVANRVLTQAEQPEMKYANHESLISVVHYLRDSSAQAA